MLDKTRIDKEHFVARYLADKLSEPERGEFEAYFMEHPEVVEELEVAAKLKLGLLELKAAGRLASGSRPRVRTLAARYPVRTIAARYPVRTIAVAATLLLGVLGLGYFTRVSLQPALATSSWAMISGPTYSIAPTRSLYDATILLPRFPQAIRLRVQLPRAARSNLYRLALAKDVEDPSSTEAVSLENLSAGPDGFVVIYLNSRRFGPGRYELTIAEAIGPALAGASSTFKIKMAAAD